MLQFLTGKGEKQQKKVQSDISGMIKNQLKKQFCQLCQKKAATKVSFGKQFKPSFTCATCEIDAVGGVPQRLGTNLIQFENFVEVMTKQIMSYQTSMKNPPMEYKRPQDNCQQAKDKTKDLSQKVKQQYKKLKKTVKQRQDVLIEEALKQNSIPIFEQVSKLFKEKKMGQLENGQLILKKSMCNNKGLHFSDEEIIQEANHSINEKFAAIKKESKVKLKPLEDLVDEINNISLD